MSPAVQSIADLITETKRTSGEIPPSLVGASTVIVGDSMYVFGGRLVSSRQMTNHLYVLNLSTLKWTRHAPSPDSTPPPRARYFHTASVYKNHMVVFGGMGHVEKGGSQDLLALDDVCLLNLTNMTWTYPEIGPSVFSPQPRYAHLAVIAHDKLVVMGGQDMTNRYIKQVNVLDMKTFIWIQGCSLEGQYGAYRSIACSPPLYDKSLGWNATSSYNIDTTDTTTATTDPLAVCVYSNYNFTDVIRSLQTFHLSGRTNHVEPKDHSADMSGTALPPGLRFPMGHLVGHHMILTGTYLTPTHRSFHMWALNLSNRVWMRIDTGNVLSTGSWNRGVLGDNSQTLYVLGHRDRDLLDDYNRRQVNFDHIVAVDMEAFGIYLHPPSTCAPIAQELGLSMLNEPSMADVDLVTSDKKAIPVNSSILARRWKHFDRLLKEDHSNLTGEQRHRTLLFPETYAVGLAFLQYIYTDHLMTTQQHQPHVLSRLLILADMYNMPRLIKLATHALHQILTISTASMVYETAALTCQTALQIRALRVMVNAKKMLQQHQMMQQDGARTSLEQQPEDYTMGQTCSEENKLTLTAPFTLRHMATSKSTTTQSDPSHHVIPTPKMSKSGTLISHTAHSFTLDEDRIRMHDR
ncbi:galactose oxidase [Lichtheimia corymbifera JMRC:FSU:9682]|uniref:Galactose oxidase n=1 Tax=Lichtheimia corymbifera JMRC:FSU:9682 TaxID=1263082 RepID=A0A068RTQ2_9FUNG|nr:galactose oxidase [Lichtheimia corymbifera JMRC:FSU:9682]